MNLDLRSPKQIRRERRAMSAIVWFVVAVSCLTLANHVGGWI